MSNEYVKKVNIEEVTGEELKKFFLDSLGLGKGQPWKDRLFAWVMWLIPIVLFTFLISNLSPHVCTCMNETTFMTLKITCKFVFEDCKTECDRYDMTLIEEMDISDINFVDALKYVHVNNTTPINISNTVNIAGGS